MSTRIGLPDIIERQVTLEGIGPMMLDRYAGDNKTTLPVESKMYFLPDGKTLCIPARNLLSFLSAKNSLSVAKLIGGRGYQSLADALLGYTQIEPVNIPLTRNGEPIVFNGFRDGRDEIAHIYVDKAVARLKGGIPNPKERPVIELPWEMEFIIRVFKNDVFDETLLKTGIMRGGLQMGMGTYRGLFGKFIIKEWK